MSTEVVGRCSGRAARVSSDTDSGESGDTGTRQFVFAADAADLIWREWDDGVLVFQRSSNKTHLLNAVSATALEVLCERPVNARELAAAAADRLGRALDREFIDQIDALLDYFDSLGLVWEQGGTSPVPRR